MNKLKYLAILAAAFAGLYIGSYIYPGRKIIDLFGISEEYWHYRNNISALTAGIFSTLFALIGTRLLGANALVALLSALILFLSLFLANLAKHGALFTLSVVSDIGRVLPGFFVGVFFIVGIWFSIFQLFDSKPNGKNT